MIEPRAALKAALETALPVLAEYVEAKTLAQYTRQLRQYARDYFTGKLDDGGFLDRMIAAITSQINRAWNEGMRANGLDPQTEKDEDMQEVIDGIITSEENHVTNLADLINQQRTAGVTDMTAIYYRCDMWANRYTDTVNRAKLYTAALKDKLEWVLGPTEHHCQHNEKPGGWGCARLAGVVASRQQWEEAGVRPQGEMLSCNGFNCKCQLVPTKKRRTRGGIPRP